MREDEASPQIYVVAVQFVILSGFSLSGKSRWYDGDELPFSPQQIYLLSYFIKYICDSHNRRLFSDALASLDLKLSVAPLIAISLY